MRRFAGFAMSGGMSWATNKKKTKIVMSLRNLSQKRSNRDSEMRSLNKRHTAKRKFKKSNLAECKVG